MAKSGANFSMLRKFLINVLLENADFSINRSIFKYYFSFSKQTETKAY